MNKTYIIVVAVILIIATFVGLSYYQSSTAKTDIGFGGAYSTCSNERLQVEFKALGYNVNCVGKDMGSSALVGLVGDPNEKVDLIVTSTTDSHQKLKDSYPDRQIGDYSTLFSSPMLPLIQKKDLHVLIDSGLATMQGNYPVMTSDTLNHIYELQATGTATWGDLGVTDPSWKNAPIIMSGPNPFISGTGWTGFSLAGSCLSSTANGFAPCSQTLDYNMINDPLREQMRGIYASYGSQSEDGNVINYMKQWMYGTNKVLMIMGNESFPILFATDLGNPSFVEDMVPVYVTYTYNTAQFAHSTSKPGEKFIKDILANPKIAEIVNKELGSRMGYTNSTLSPDVASWVPASDPITYIQLPQSNTKNPILCYIGQAEHVDPKLMWVTTFGKKTDATGNNADDGSTFREAVDAFCENQ